MTKKLLSAALALALILTVALPALATSGPLSPSQNASGPSSPSQNTSSPSSPSQNTSPSQNANSPLGPALSPNGATAPDSTVSTMYVVTDNGKGLNVRSQPYVGNNIITVAKYGSRIDVLRFLDNGWACIRWNGSEAYVQSRFLQWYVPGPVVTPTPTPAPTQTPSTYNYSSTQAYGNTIAGLNAEFRTSRQVAPYTISVRPVRSSGWVNMRYAPGQDMEVLGIYYNGDKLTVIAETQNWYQVVDPESGATGYMMKTYTVRLY